MNTTTVPVDVLMRVYADVFTDERERSNAQIGLLLDQGTLSDSKPQGDSQSGDG